MSKPETCFKCDYHGYTRQRVVVCTEKDNKIIVDGGSKIQDWCPLPDAGGSE